MLYYACSPTCCVAHVLPHVVLRMFSHMLCCACSPTCCVAHVLPHVVLRMFSHMHVVLRMLSHMLCYACSPTCMLYYACFPTCCVVHVCISCTFQHPWRFALVMHAPQSMFSRLTCCACTRMQVGLQETIQLFWTVDFVPALTESSTFHDILLNPLCQDTRPQIHNGKMGQIGI